MSAAASVRTTGTAVIRHRPKRLDVAFSHNATSDAGPSNFGWWE